MKRKLMLLLACLFVGIGLVTAQTQKVTGVVISEEDGQPVVGASVLVKGTTLGTITDVDGNFNLSNVPSSAKTLQISYIGMQTQEVVIKPNLRVVLKADAQKLDEVVVTAMGISREKKALGYAVQDVKSDALTRAANTDLAGALQGKVSGIDITPSSGMPGASSKITIRGSRSFTGDNTPLYVIDGMPIASTADVSTSLTDGAYGTDYANRAVDIDPNDIESINILKGQAASALYGMRASNGVIVITTKSGKGADKGKPTITFSTNLSFDKISTLPELQQEYAQGSGGTFDPSSPFAWGPKISELANDPTYGGNTDNSYTSQYGKQSGKYYVPQLAAAGMNPWATPQAYNNMKDFFETGVSWSNNVNVAQRFDKGNYSFSLGNTTSNGIVPSTGMDRYNVKMSAEAQLHPNWTTGFNGNFVTSKISKQSTANTSVVATIYNAPVSYNMAGIPSHIEGDPYTQNTYRDSWIDDAYWAVDNNQFSERSQRFFGNAFVKYTTKFGTDNHKLDIKYQIGDDAYTTNYSEIYGYGSTWAPTGEDSEYHYTVNELNSLLTAAYTWNINEEWTLDALIGNEFVDKKTKYEYAYSMNFNFPGWNHLNNASVFSNESLYNKKRTVGNFANLSVAWKNMLYLSGSIRNDIVSSMPRDNRSFTYPSVSLGFIFTELAPLKNNILTFGKIRASYAEVGMAGDYTQSYYYTPSYGGGFYMGNPIVYPINGAMAYIPYYKVYDPNLKPQNTKSYELGADLTFLNGLVTLNYTYSRQNVKDQIFEVPLAGSTGASSMIMNGGKIHTNTHELTLGISPVDTKNFKLDFAFNFSKIDNYVDELAPGVESIMLGGFVTPQVRAGIGDKFPVIYGKSYMRNDEGKIVVDQNGLPMQGEDAVIGTVSPDFRLGFNTNIELYKFRISAVFDWKQGGQMYSGTAGEMNYYGVSKLSGDMRKNEFIVENAVKETGKDADGNSIYAPNDIKVTDAQAYFTRRRSIDESYIYDNSYIKLRELSVSYPVFSKKWLNVNVNVFARNILVWSEMKGFDPEASQGNDNMGGAFERFSLPGTASYGFGFNVKF
ncbi:SusC/RagA family TonB-linked outer membrane protein [Bacteroides ovatus]|jgi:TonB-linked SusC/RagA family outer membrane protein|uniref:SusC/RagA family TonB-linked outer membrane protein n=8 Tax=Bacteria TaxID=2 RepID=UPI000B569EA3|nr:SusC/RagA family TonB-linked outer membrane protein [Bacteroides ovatus]MBT0715680.1 TonB-dependent receptor SusC [Bacteroides ovatus CL03T12C18]MDC2348522.1 SusC/RagA family TonB-linked outer membrane protein [Bacteroides ovatus]MDC2739874.1 SusC/RagA family TonB-linked outer membrane protein [Bacteroides ovatus]MDC2754244.1 SusC/RagA family TonB-linked outer membrane protein [Bacteroides ovatus]MDC2777875.1 SusC/RagA family TonB-linked outer membrane protein [Bacteroides ovatus]